MSLGDRILLGVSQHGEIMRVVIDYMQMAQKSLNQAGHAGVDESAVNLPFVLL